MYERDDEYYNFDEEADRREEELRERERRNQERLEQLRQQEWEMREEERQQDEYERAMELRYFCGREGHRLEAAEHGTSCKCGKEFVEVFFA